MAEITLKRKLYVAVLSTTTCLWQSNLYFRVCNISSINTFHTNTSRGSSYLHEGDVNAEWWLWDKHTSSSEGLFCSWTFVSASNKSCFFPVHHRGIFFWLIRNHHGWLWTLRDDIRAVFIQPKLTFKQGVEAVPPPPPPLPQTTPTAAIKAYKTIHTRKKMVWLIKMLFTLVKLQFRSSANVDTGIQLSNDVSHVQHTFKMGQNEQLKRS